MQRKSIGRRTDSESAVMLRGIITRLVGLRRSLVSNDRTDPGSVRMQSASQRYRPTHLLRLRNLMGCARVNHVSRHSHETASSGKRSEGTAGCRVDRLERMEIMPLLGKQVLGSKA